MKSCNREELVLDSIRAGRDDAEVAAHVATCNSCADVAIVAGAVDADHRQALRHAPVPPSGLVWWRMQRRAADDAKREATRAVIAAQTVSFVAAIAIAIAVFSAIGGASLRALRGVMHMPSAQTLAYWSAPLALGVFVCLALAPVALYFAFTRD
jgi:hypothetical protein